VQVEEKFSSVDPEKTKAIVDNRSDIQSINMIGIFVLGLNKSMQVRHIELIHLEDVTKRCIVDFLP
jgi:hypothetical protein